MEPDVMPLHSPAPLHGGGDEDDDDGDVGSEEDEFGGFSVVVSCSPLRFPRSTEPPSSPRQPSPAKPAPRQPCSSFNPPVRQSQPVSSLNPGSNRVQMDVEGRAHSAATPSHLANGYDGGDSCYRASVDNPSSPKEETGFADFTVFTDPAAQPWCCGFSPVGTAEQWGKPVEGNLPEEICDAGQQVVLNSEPRSRCALDGDVCTKPKHCEKRHPAPEEPSQDHHQPQEAAAALGFQFITQGHSLGESEDDEEGREKTFFILPQTFSQHDAASDDLGSFGDDFSFEGVSADLEPNVSSLTSQEDRDDWAKTDDEDEELGSYEHFDCSVNDSMEDLRQPAAEKCLRLYNKPASQESHATSSLSGVQSHFGANAEDQFSDVNHSRFKCQHDREHADVRVESLGSLPLSDSFADFCSAPTLEEGNRSWAEFNDQRTQTSSLLTDGGTEQQVALSPSSGCQDSLLYRVQQLLQASFPAAVAPAEGADEFLSLNALLHIEQLTENEEHDEEETGAQRLQRGPWWPQQDPHGAVGLQFQWGGSHTNRTLLSCLGVDTRNIVFIGIKKQPVTVPAFASGLGLLEPTKDAVPAVPSLPQAAVTAPTSPGPRDVPDPARDSLQGALPPSQDWTSRGLSSSQDGMSPRRAPHFWGRK